LSSGGALALQAAASGLPITSVIAYEPPYVNEGSDANGAVHERQLRSLLAAGKRGAAVTYFMKDMVGAPSAVVVMMRLMPWIWRKLVAVADTLPYDAAVMTDFRIPYARLQSIVTRVLILNGAKTDRRLKAAAAALASAIPGARHQELPGQTHNVSPAVLSPIAVEFFSDTAGTPDHGR
jgi:hypothetical protein